MSQTWGTPGYLPLGATRPPADRPRPIADARRDRRQVSQEGSRRTLRRRSRALRCARTVRASDVDGFVPRRSVTHFVPRSRTAALERESHRRADADREHAVARIGDHDEGPSVETVRASGSARRSPRSAHPEARRDRRGRTRRIDRAPRDRLLARRLDQSRLGAERHARDVSSGGHRRSRTVRRSAASTGRHRGSSGRAGSGSRRARRTCAGIRPIGFSRGRARFDRVTTPSSSTSSVSPSRSARGASQRCSSAKSAGWSR